MVAWLAFATGAVVSIGANVLHALDGDGPTDFGRLVAAGWAPVALLLVAELVARARQSGPWWIITLRWSGTAVVAAVAAIVSYGHMRDLLLSYGETALVAHLLPLSVDGLLLVASLALASPDGIDQQHAHGESEKMQVNSNVITSDVARGGRDPWLVNESAPAARDDDEKQQVSPTVVNADGSARGADPVTVTTAHGGDTREQARHAYRAALNKGVPPTGKELAARFGRSESWGRTRIRECRAA
ncbi:DUF2637 domain-containing protein [Nocardiopsis sp. HNM0947]|uniref:DUF2637 domain-containing protein n=1 Tax=Nocardiopsis coralli TaxID=2772213 RepID=A0ABR9P8L4_9ACTN|nr:DUF2637 domain-containing protein [Nocardiopsis coralli]MBE3000188.1 DUF2637 domain-containing protein [Nocardiopsis coralli]